MSINMKLVGTFTLDPLEPILKFWSQRLENLVHLNARFADFDSVFAELLNPNSDMNSRAGYNFVLYRAQDFGEELGERFVNALKFHANINKDKTFVVQCKPAKAGVKFIPPTGLRNVAFISWEEFENIAGFELEDCHDPVTEKLASIPYTDDYYIKIGTYLTRLAVVQFMSSQFKVFITDCDHTLWNGICSEVDSASDLGVQKDSVFFKLQQNLKKQYESGRLICLNSANDLSDVTSVFNNRKDFPLKYDMITSAKVNWNPKMKNIQQLAGELSLGTDSFIFLDDDHINIESVRENMPEVLSVEVDHDLDQARLILENLWVLDQLKFTTKEDKSRTDMYKRNAQRNLAEKEQGSSYTSFLKSIDLNVELIEVSSGHPYIARISQMTQRTNRFNTTGKRMTEDDVEQYVTDRNQMCFAFDVKDKFGSYGTAGVAFLCIKSDEVEVESFLMSCRVLNRGVEFTMLKQLSSQFPSKTLVVRYTKSKKNAPVLHALDNIASFVQLKKKYRFEVGDLDQRSAFDYVEFSTRNTEDDTTETLSRNLPNSEFKGRNQILLDIAKNLNSLRLVKLAMTASIRVPTSATTTNTKTLLIDIASQVLNIDASEYIDTPLMELGLTSILAVRFVAELIRAFPESQSKISTTLVFDFPTINAIDARLRCSDIASNATQPGPNPTNDTADTCITSMACRFPGGVKNPVEFWDLLCNKSSAKSLIEEKRWDVNTAYPTDCSSEVLYNHNVSQIELFDASMFGIPPVEAKCMDPQQRLALTVGYEALMRSPLGASVDKSLPARQRFEGKNIGVFVAVCNTDWAYLRAENPDNFTSYSFSGRILSVTSGRIANIFGLTGPAVNFDTACSSSLVALNYAKKSLEDGDCEAALVIGVNLNLHPETFIQLSRAKQLSPTGECRTFDESANGFARGEGCGAFVLQPSNDSLPAESKLCKVRQVHLNQDGRAASLSAPNGSAQASCLRRGLERAGVNSDHVSFMELHGSGTRLGDAIEFNSVKTVFNQKTRTMPLSLGAVKTNIGHLESAAGMAGLIKTVLVLMTRAIPPNLYLGKLSPDIVVGDFKVCFPNTIRRIEKKGVIFAGVSSFGMSGTNGFALLESTFVNTDVDIKQHIGLTWTPRKVNPKLFGWERAKPLNLRSSFVANNISCVKPHIKQFDDVESKVRDCVSEVVDISSASPGATFADLGVDSLAGIELANKLVRSFPMFTFTAPAQLIYSYPTVAAIIEEVRRLSEKPKTIDATHDTEINMNVCEVLCEVLDSQSIDMNQSFTSMGMDSLAGIEFSNRIVKYFPKLNFENPGNLIYDYPNVEAISNYIQSLQELSGHSTTVTSVKPSKDVTEEKVRLILSNIIALDSFNMNSSFVELGMDSLAGIEFANLIQKEFPKITLAEPSALIYTIRSPTDLICLLQKKTSLSVSDKMTLLLTGQGAQYFDMGRGLYFGDITFRKKMLEVNSLFKKVTGDCFLDIMYNFKNSANISVTDINDTRFAQIALFALEVSLFEVLLVRSERNILNQIGFLVGHSIGEIAALVISETLSLEDGVTLVAARGSAMSSCKKGSGHMVAVKASAELAEHAINTLSQWEQGQVSIAAINGPKSIVLSGDSAILKIILDKLKVPSKELQTSHAFHSPLMSAAVKPVREAVSRLKFSTPTLTVISNVTGLPLNVKDMSQMRDYLERHLLEGVNFLGSIKYVLGEGCAKFLEIGPMPTLSKLALSIAGNTNSIETLTWLSKTEEDMLNTRELLAKLSIANKPDKAVIVKKIDDIESSTLSGIEGDAQTTFSSTNDLIRHRETGERLPGKELVSEKLDRLSKRLFDPATLMDRLENRLLDRLMTRWDTSQQDFTPHTAAFTSVSSVTATETAKAPVKGYILPESKSMVFVLEGSKTSSKADLLKYMSTNRRLLTNKLKDHGSILFRNWNLKDEHDFKDVFGIFEHDGAKMRDYLDGISPRTNIIPGIYTSTEYAAEYNMAQHNEMSYNPHPPSKIAFFCQVPAVPGTGRTPLANSKTVLESLPEDLTRKYKELGLQYIVNSPSKGRGPGVSWQKMYDTEDKLTVETICNKLGIKTRWNTDGSLTTFRFASATKNVNGQEIWFNHSHLFHPSDLPKPTQEALRAAYGDKVEKYPKYCRFANGEEIPSQMLDKIREVEQASKISFDWKQGDVLVINNFLLSHGRQKFDKNSNPKRRILASMIF